METVTAISLGLSMWGALWSTVLGVLRVRDHIVEGRRRLHVSGIVENSGDGVQVRVVNPGHRPTTLLALEVVYGTRADSAYPQRVYHHVLETPARLLEGQLWARRIERTELGAGSVTQREKCRLWLIARVAGPFGDVGGVHALVLPGDLVKKPAPAIAEQWIAADVFLGFDQMPSRAPSLPVHDHRKWNTDHSRF